MQRVMKIILPLLAMIAICGAPSPVQAAKYGVKDEGKFFSADPVAQAEKVIQQIRTADDRDVLVTTYDKIPDDLKDKYNPEQKAKFFLDWAEQIGRNNGVSGVVILITREPKRLEIVVGNKTRQRQFTEADRSELYSRMIALLKEEKYDDALLTGVKFIKERMDQNERHATSAQGNSPPPPYPTQNSNNPGNSGGSRVGGLLCLGVGLLVIVFMIISAANRNRGGYGYGAPPPQGGYPPTYGGGYPQGGMGGGYPGGGYPPGGGGGGFGRGLLGGLLGGAIGSWGYDKLAHPGGENPSYPPPQGGGAGFNPPPDQTDTSFSGGGGDFGSSNDSGGGGDFGGGGDSGGGGGDFGGGGGDSGGGGGDF